MNPEKVMETVLELVFEPVTWLFMRSCQLVAACTKGEWRKKALRAVVIAGTALAADYTSAAGRARVELAKTQ